jgi:hypothetical protein
VGSNTASQVVEHLLSEPHGHALAVAFPRIQSANVKKRLAELARELAANEDPPAELPDLRAQGKVIVRCPFSLREALLLVPVLGIVGVMAGEVSSHSAVATVVSLATSGSAIGLYLFVEWTWPRNGGVEWPKRRGTKASKRHIV